MGLAAEIFLQVAILILTLAIFFVVQYVPKQVLTKHRTDNRSAIQTKRHLDRANHLLFRAKSNPHKDQSQTLAKSAITEIEKALTLSPKDPIPQVLKSLALDLLGHKGSALRSLDLALASPRVKSLTQRERAEAMVRRAELKVSMNRKRRMDSAIRDLEEAIGMCKGEDRIKTSAFCLLGEFYELKGMKEEAGKAFREALKIEPGSSVARLGLERLRLA